MRKFLAVVLCVLMAGAVFAACSGEKQQQGHSKSDEAATSESADVSDTKEDKMQNAVIKEADALKMMSSYTADELSLSEEDMKNPDFSFMYSESPNLIDDKEYVKVIAAVKNKKENGDTVTFTLDVKGEYYIRFDGKELLKKNLETGEYTKMEVKEIPSDAVESTAPADTSAAESTEEDTTK